MGKKYYRGKRSVAIIKILTLLVFVVISIIGAENFYSGNEANFYNKSKSFVIEYSQNFLNLFSSKKSSLSANSIDDFRPFVQKENVQILPNIGYTSAFSNSLAVPLWVAYIAKYPFLFELEKRPSSFKKDSRTMVNLTHKDYTNSGYDRGHLAPNYTIGKCYGAQAQLQTFYMSNIIPQKHSLNAGVWKSLEQYIANDLAKKYEKILVIVGPVFGSKISKIKNKVAIPNGSYAIIMTKNLSNHIQFLGFIFPQEPKSKNIWDYCTTIDIIEAKTNIDFFSQIEDSLENTLESKIDILPFKN